MKHFLKLSVVAAALLIGVASCSDDEKTPLTLTLNPTSVSGKIGDTIKTTVTVEGGDITSLVVTKSVNGQVVAGYQRNVTVSGSTYEFAEMIAVGDENGALIYTFTGNNSTGTMVDATDLSVTVNLSGLPLLLKYDWKLIEENINGGDSTKDGQRDNVYRMNADYSYQLDWGTAATNMEDWSDYCAWKIQSGNASQLDSIAFITYGIFHPETALLQAWKVTKLEGTDLWLSAVIDMKGLGGLGAGTRFIQKYTGISKSPTFTPKGGTNANCQPGTY